MITNPIALFAAAQDALNRQDYGVAADLCDPASLRAFQREMLARFAPGRPRHVMTVDDYLKHQPDAPREVAEYHVARMRELDDDGRMLRSEFPGMDSVAQLAALDPAELFAWWLRGHSPAAHLRRMADQGQIPEALVEAITAEAAGTQQFVALGWLPDGERMGHIVVRFRVDAAEAPDDPELFAALTAEERALGRDLSTADANPHIQLCRRQPDGGWLLIADYRFLQRSSWSFSISAGPPSPSGEAG